MTPDIQAIPVPEPVTKRSHLWLIVLALWFLCAFTIQQPAVALLFDNLTLLQRSSLLVFLGWINFAWLQGISQIVLAAFAAYVSRSELEQKSVRTNGEASVAILYTTMNDFSERAALSCVSQEHPSFHVFLLDDSTEPSWQSQVNAFHRRFPETTTVLRREYNKGFKAGNLNHALRRIANDYEFFAVCDADGTLPVNFTADALSRFVSNSIGFVQACHRAAVSKTSTRFESELAPSVDIYWSRVMPQAEKFGFVLFHGHGGIIRTSAWAEIGGFPEVVAEDLAFSTRAREIGYVGAIASDVICTEEVPKSYVAFSTRQLKYTRGAWEHLRLYMWSFLTSRRIRWFEKLDRLLASLALVSTFPLLIFLFDFAIALPFAFPEPEGRSLAGVNRSILMAYFPRIDPSRLPVFTWPFFIMTVVTMLAPLVPAVWHLGRNPGRLVRYVVTSVAVHLSLVVHQAWDLGAVACTRKNFYPTTGDPSSWKPRGIPFCFCDATTLGCIGTAVFLVTAVLSASLGLVPICVATGFALIARGLSWEHVVVRIVVLLPIAAILFLIATGCEALGLSGISLTGFNSGF